MAFIEIGFTESERHTLCMTLLFLNILQLFVTIFCFSLGAYISLSVNQKAHLAKDYSIKPIGGTLSGCSIVSFMLHCAAAKICNSCGYRNNSQNKLLAIIIGFLVMSCVLVAVTVFCLVQQSKLKQVLSHGLLGAMKIYRVDKNRKRDFDDMQIDYKCCGSFNYTDWFRIKWMPENSVPLKEDKLFSRTEHLHSVPFSCCDPSHPGPCFHRLAVVDRGAYKYPNHGFYRTGCTEVLLGVLQEMVQEVAIFVQLPFFIELMLVILTRYLQTSLDDCGKRNDPSGIGIGRLIGKCGPSQGSSGFVNDIQKELEYSDGGTAPYVAIRKNVQKSDLHLKEILNSFGRKKSRDSVAGTGRSEDDKMWEPVSREENADEKNYSTKEKKKRKIIHGTKTSKGKEKPSRNPFKKNISKSFNVHGMPHGIINKHKMARVDSGVLTSSTGENDEIIKPFLKQRGGKKTTKQLLSADKEREKNSKINFDKKCTQKR